MIESLCQINLLRLIWHHLQIQDEGSGHFQLVSIMAYGYPRAYLSGNALNIAWENRGEGLNLRQIFVYYSDKVIPKGTWWLPEDASFLSFCKC